MRLNTNLITRWMFCYCGWIIGLANVYAFVMPVHVEAQIAVRGKVIYTMAGEPIRDGVILIRDGKIASVAPASEVTIPDDFQVIEGTIVTPGLIDAHATVGLTGIYNQSHDQDHRESSAPIQAELRALDAINVREQLIEYLRGLGVTTVHTGHSPGELISGQTLVMKTVGNTIEEATLVESAAVVATLGPSANRSGGSPGTRGKQMAMLRQELIKAQEYLAKQEKRSSNGNDGSAENADNPSANPITRDLRLEALARVLKRELPLLVTANRAQDISSALRLANEFNFMLWLDGAAESYLLIDEIRDAKVPVFLHPSMIRTAGEYENLSFETGAKLADAGIPVLMQSGFEGYVPKVRVVLFEAAILAANGMTFEQALATITRDAARILGLADRIGTLRVGLDADIAVFDGDPFEYTTKCHSVIINGRVVSIEPR
ncbi:MAG TPA: amidohydrolase family protein [Pirellulaceae bacterium]|nr:amidohydrolase family protein [Pirellulaceae bacterium]HMO93318.1 amidohydrolase family protein [Pirellulaceae bacterium]HMP69143.1 amidohydrolase family protein [Pirellulaceae bacterium]